MSERVRILPVAQAGPQLDREMRDWFAEEFGAVRWKWAEPDYYAIMSVDEQHAGRLAIFDRSVKVNGAIVRVGGIGGVATKPQFRMRGVASALLTRATDFMRDELSLEFGLLLCRPQVAPVYAKLGWMRVDGPTTFSQPGGTETYPNYSMILRLGARDWPSGPIDMMGLPW
jgi:GNAT superfamily N-acetyltransferase